MARVKVIKLREQAAHFGLYRTSVGGDDSIIVRRKVGEPTDYLHSKSRKLIRQRENLALASHRYAILTPSQKAITRRQFQEVEYIKNHGKTDTKLLSGRQLFISKVMASLAQTGLPIALPMELCIMLVDPELNPLAGELWLRYLRDEQWLDCGKQELDTGNWLFSQVPPAQQAYRPYGEAEGYIDPLLPAHQYMNGAQIKAYHYHTLLPREAVPTAFFYPHILPETDSCDGWTRRYTGTDLTWADVHDGPGDRAQSSAEVTYADIQALRTPDAWRLIRRCFLLFNTEAIPLGATILEAKLHLWFFGYLNTIHPAATLNVFQSWPISTGQIVAADYQNIGAVPLSEPKLIDNIPLFDWSTFTLNSAGRPLVIPGGCTKLGIREATFDAPNIEPPWTRIGRIFSQWESADAQVHIPCLEVTYIPP